MSVNFGPGSESRGDLPEAGRNYNHAPHMLHGAKYVDPVCIPCAVPGHRAARSLEQFWFGAEVVLHVQTLRNSAHPRLHNNVRKHPAALLGFNLPPGDRPAQPVYGGPLRWGHG